MGVFFGRDAVGSPKGSGTNTTSLSLGRFFGLLVAADARIPGQALFVEADHHLGTANVGDTGGHDVGLVTVLPLDEEHQLAGRVGRADDSIRVQPAVKATWFRVAPAFLLLLLAVGPLVVVLHFGRLRRRRRLRVGLLFPLLFELRNQAWAVEVLLGLPSVLALAVAFPLEQELYLALANATVDDPLDDELLWLGRRAVFVGAFLVSALPSLFHGRPRKKGDALDRCCRRCESTPPREQIGPRSPLAPLRKTRNEELCGVAMPLHERTKKLGAGDENRAHDADDPRPKPAKVSLKQRRRARRPLAGARRGGRIRFRDEALLRSIRTPMGA